MKNTVVNLPKPDLLTLKEWRILIQDWVTLARIGILAEELSTTQDIRLTIHCDIRALLPLDAPTIEGVVCYDQLLKSIQRLIESQHYYLLETLSDAIASHCLQDKRVQSVFVRIEKFMASQQKFCFGVEMTRYRGSNV